jgi:hypothetical protein
MTGILPAVRAVANVEDDAVGEEADRTEAGRRLAAPEVKTAPTPGASAFRPETLLFVKRRADETIDTDDAFDWAVEAIDLDGETSGVATCTEREPSITPPTIPRFCSGAARGGSRWNSATAKKQTINTLRTMLGATWRFMVVLARGGLVGDTLNAVIFVIGSNHGPL